MLHAFDDGAVFGERWGDGPPNVVALHGWARTHGDFAAALRGDHAAAPTSTVALDLPGFGASPPPPEPWGSAQYAAVVARIVSGFDPGSRPPVVVGHSLGGRVAVHLAASYPDLVGGLVLVGAPVGPRSAGRNQVAPAYAVVRRLRRMGLVSEATLDRARQRHGSADYRAATGVVRQILVRVIAEDYQDVLARVRCPVTLLWGANDTVVPPSVAQAVAERIPGSTLMLCPGVGHLLPSQAPSELRDAVEGLLARIGGRAGGLP